MQPRLFLSNNELLEAKCTKCYKYLSVPPITIESNKPVCGRCTQDNTTLENHRAHFYENLARLMFFPCSNDILGCPVKLPWGQILGHETKCQFVAIVCPAIDCEEELTKQILLKHFQTYHNHLILQGNECNLTTDENAFLNRLIIWKRKPLIVQTKSESESVYLRISNFEEDPANNPRLKLIINSQQPGNSVFLNKFKIIKFDSKLPTFSNEESINVISLRNILETLEIRCKFKLEEDMESEASDNYSRPMFSELECPVCTEYMAPPIYMCLTGHSICIKCKNKLSQCPSCRLSFGNGRNFTLERITEYAIYACANKDQGCDFAGKLENIQQHNSVCPTASLSPSTSSFSLVRKKVNCFINNIITCNWKGFYSELYDHLLSKHFEYFSNLRYPIAIFVGYHNLEILKYDNHIFKLTVYWDAIDSQLSRWAVMCIGNTERLDEYMFNLEFVNGKKIFTINEVCETKSLPEVNYNSTKYIDIPYNLLEPFIIDDKLVVKLNLVKIN